MSDQLDQLKKPFLYVVVCAAGIAGDVGKLITAAQEHNWDVGVVATPPALGFIDAHAVEAQTGYPIRSAWRSPGDPRPLPAADAIAVAPAHLQHHQQVGVRNLRHPGAGHPLRGIRLRHPDCRTALSERGAGCAPRVWAESGAATTMGVVIGDHEPFQPEADGGADRFRWEQALELLEPLVR